MRILVVGAGAVGGYFGGRLAQAGADVAFVVRPERQAQLERTGLRIVSPLGDTVVSPRLLSVSDKLPMADLVVLACKAHGLPAAANTAAGAIGPTSRVLPLLNGVDHLEELTAQFGRERVLGGLAHIGATIGAEGEILHLNHLNVIRFGAQDGAPDECCRALEETFRNTVVDGVETTAIMPEMWDKFVFVSTLAGVTCLMRSSVGVVASLKGGAAFISAMLDEAVSIAAAEGQAPSAEQLVRIVSSCSIRPRARQPPCCATFNEARERKPGMF